MEYKIQEFSFFLLVPGAPKGKREATMHTWNSLASPNSVCHRPFLFSSERITETVGFFYLGEKDIGEKGRSVHDFNLHLLQL